MGNIVKIDDTFCLDLRGKLDSLDDALRNRVPFNERGEMLKFIAGLSLVFHVASGAGFPNRVQLNYVLRMSLGAGYSWYTCLQFLSGERARKIFADQQDLFREIGGAPLMLFANHVLPDMKQNVHKILVTQPVA